MPPFSLPFSIPSLSSTHPSIPSSLYPSTHRPVPICMSWGSASTSPPRRETPLAAATCWARTWRSGMTWTGESGSSVRGGPRGTSSSASASRAWPPASPPTATSSCSGRQEPTTGKVKGENWVGTQFGKALGMDQIRPEGIWNMLYINNSHCCIQIWIKCISA